jgi:hypothetical protein
MLPVIAIAYLDYGLLSMPAMRNLGGTAVLYGHVTSDLRVQSAG